MTFSFVEPKYPEAPKRNLKSLWAFILKTPTLYQWTTFLFISLYCLYFFSRASLIFSTVKAPGVPFILWGGQFPDIISSELSSCSSSRSRICWRHCNPVWLRYRIRWWLAPPPRITTRARSLARRQSNTRRSRSEQLPTTVSR